MKTVSIIYPPHNEKKNVNGLTHRIAWVLGLLKWNYEIVYAGDTNSETGLYLSSLAPEIPVRVHEPSPAGYAHTVYAHTTGEAVVLLDADRQYPPEVIPAMVEKLEHADIVVGNPVQDRLFARITSVLYKRLGMLLWGMPVNIRSGIKVCKKEVLKQFAAHGGGYRLFDRHFLPQTKRLGWNIQGMDIAVERESAHTDFLAAFAREAVFVFEQIVLWAQYAAKSFFPFLDHPHPSERAGINFANTRDFLFIADIFSIRRHVFPETVSLFLVVCAGSAAIVWALQALTGLALYLILSWIVALFYLSLLIFKIIVVRRSVRRPPIRITKREVASLSNSELPTYTILIPLYREEKVIPQIIEAMTAIDYPAGKLDIIITLEEYDHPTIEAIKAAQPPAHFKTLILPNVKPKTKPKALNVAFPQTKGEFFVIYDAEIVPDPDQLKKAYCAFRKHPEIACLQPRLDHYNANQNIITRLFNAEFSFYYDLFLPGLQRFGFPIPLSGHSTHFRRSVLEEIGAWDPYNVTEDCDVGIRLARKGYRTEIFDSVSKEKATSTLGSWIMQRTRWMKGFIQTSLVHLRHPLRTKRELGGWRNFIAFLLTVPGTVLINVLNLFYWLLLAGWLATHSFLIQALFPGPLLYVSALSFVIGNFLFTYLNLIGSYQRGRYGLVKYSLLSFVYWILLAIATTRAAIQIVTNPHHWEKTTHGAHLTQPKNQLEMKKYALAD